ncbi:Phosphatidylinositol-glycan-specific phospholipase D [Smittium culicis]|uniref:Phosphatidylinositol-glycan-specific phospholipase D n=1 Tax=Smittium culicis TaxID=133412 RepID=A0A1R1YSN6_9FUNG|nr:Phosphatidylinositol-glycan-specific phospholipase D [Smittium culicis]
MGPISSVVNVVHNKNGFAEFFLSKDYINSSSSQKLNNTDFETNSDPKVEIHSPKTHKNFNNRNNQKHFSILKHFSRNTPNKISYSQSIGGCESIDELASKQSLIYTLAPYSLLGKSIAFGDFAGNNKSQIAIGAPFYFDNNIKSQVGAVFISNLDSFTDSKKDYQIEKISKRTMYLPTLDEIDFKNKTFDGNISFSSKDKFSMFGASLLTIDINNDGIDDLVVGAPWVYGMMAKNRGKIFIYYGNKDSGLSSTPDQIIDSDSIGIEYINKQALNGIRIGENLFSGDLNGNGIKDLIVGAPLTNFKNNLHQAGAVLVFSSSQYNRTHNITKRSSNKLTLNLAISSPNPSPYGWFGSSVASFKKVYENNFVNLLAIGSPGHRSYNDKRASGRDSSKLDSTKKLVNSNDVQVQDRTNKIGMVYGFSVDKNYRFSLNTTIGNFGAYGLFGRHLTLVDDEPQSQKSGRILISAHLSDNLIENIKYYNNNIVLGSGYHRAIKRSILKETPEEIKESDKFNSIIDQSAKLYQAGSVFATDWNLGSTNLNIDFFKKISGTSTLGHFGSSSICSDSVCYIGEPLSNKQEGRVYLWEKLNSNEPKCYYFPNGKKSRFGSGLFVKNSQYKGESLLAITLQNESRFSRLSGSVLLLENAKK